MKKVGYLFSRFVLTSQNMLGVGKAQMIEEELKNEERKKKIKDFGEVHSKDIYKILGGRFVVVFVVVVVVVCLSFCLFFFFFKKKVS